MAEVVPTSLVAVGRVRDADCPQASSATSARKVRFRVRRSPRRAVAGEADCPSFHGGAGF